MRKVIVSDDIEETAAQWAIRLDRGVLGEAEQRELDAWLEKDARHRGAFIRAQAAWMHVDRVAALSARQASLSPRLQSTRFLHAACVAAAAIGLAFLAFGIFNYYLAGRHSTQVGEVRRLSLEDGSALSLNTDSMVQVKYAKSERRIVLHEGEASFQVHHDEQRPFLVQIDDVIVRAVGTEFSVRRRATGVDVLVSEGVVEVMRGGATERVHAERVSRNHEVVVPLAEQPMAVAALADAEVLRRLSWQEGQLVFEGERLAEAVIEVNRYSNTPVVIDDPVIAAQSFVGVFRIGDSRSFAQAAALAFDARVREHDGELHVGASDR